MEKVYNTMRNVGAVSITIGIIVITIGVATGVISIICGASLLKKKSQIMF